MIGESTHTLVVVKMSEYIQLYFTISNHLYPFISTALQILNSFKLSKPSSFFITVCCFHVFGLEESYI